MPRMTQTEVNAYNARRSAIRHSGDTGGVEVEADLHEQIFAECRRRGWIALHGSMAERTSRTLGEPDFICIADAGRVFFVEVKTRTGKLSPAQLAMRCHAEKLNHAFHLVRSFEQFLEVVK